MKNTLKLFLTLLVVSTFSSKCFSQKKVENMEVQKVKTDFSDRQAIINTTNNFFIGDHTGDIKYKKLSMHEKGAYRFVNRDGEYQEYVFDLESNDADTSYKEELLHIEIYASVALVHLRLAELSGGYHYKQLTLHKIGNEWKITTITWGTEITQ